MRFNPHPPLGAGATLITTILLPSQHDVSILTRPWGRVQQQTGRHTAQPMQFQSSPAPGGGCNSFVACVARGEWCVSILTRPWGRVQRTFDKRGCWRADVSILTRPWGRVQRVGVPFCEDGHAGVSILTRPWGRVQQEIFPRTHKIPVFQSSPAPGGGCNGVVVASFCGFFLYVSILTRPWGRVQRVVRIRLWRGRGRFNPHPPLGAGATDR